MKTNQNGIAVAVAVDDAGGAAVGLSPAVFATEVDLKSKIPLHKRKWFWPTTIGTLVVLGAVTAGVTLGLLRGTSTNPPTISPTIKITLAPTTDREEKIWAKMNDISTVDLIAARAVATGEDLLDEEFSLHETPQYIAADWIVNNDTQQLSADNETLTQRYVLAILYFATAGDTWNATFDENKTYFSDESECLWFGVECEKEDTVSEINLQMNNLIGTIPEEIIFLNGLERLYLGSNYLQGTIPEWMGEMRELVELELADNEFTGTIPESFYNLKLDALDLRANNLTGSISESIQNMTSVIGLYLFNNFFTGSLPQGINELPNLKWVEVFDNEFTGTIPDLENPKLKNLELYENFFEGTIPSSFGKLKKLRSLDLSQNLLNGTIPEELYDLDKLKQLRLANNDFSGSISTRIGLLENLDLLDLTRNSFTGTIPEALANLTFIQEVILRDNEFSGSVPSVLGNLFNMSKLWVHYNPNLEGEMPAEICDLTFENLFDLVADCMGNRATLQCDCCYGCCDNIERICRVA